eukprot:g2194.t1
MPLGATRTFRDPSIVDLPGATKKKRDGGRGERRSSAATPRRESSPLTSNGRRASLHEWLALKTATSEAESTEQLGRGGKKQDGAERASHHKERSRLDPCGSVFPADDEEDLGHDPSSAELPLGYGAHDGGESNHNQPENQGVVPPTPTISLSRGRVSDNMATGSDDQPVSENELATQGDDNAGIEHIYDSPTVGDGVPRQVTFLSGTMGLTVDISDPMQPQPPDQLRRYQQTTANDDQAQFPASPCSGVILETSPRYGSLQRFRKEMSRRGINAQMFHTGWRGSFLPPRDIRLFMSDSRKTSVLYWRYRKNMRGRRGGERLGAEDRQVIPVSSLANIGPAELYPQPRSRGRLSSWLPLPISREKLGDDGEVVDTKFAKKKEIDSVEEQEVGVAQVPVLALSYWVDGEPR